MRAFRPSTKAPSSTICILALVCSLLLYIASGSLGRFWPAPASQARKHARKGPKSSPNAGAEALPLPVTQPGGAGGRPPSPQPLTPAAAAGLSRHAPVLGAGSSRWAPLVLSACTEGMPRHFAPCLVGNRKDASLAYGEELIYPAFSIPEPGFLSPEHAALWRAKAAQYAPDRFFLWGDRAVFPAQHGQTLVLRNVTFNDDPPSDRWERGCMDFAAGHRALAPLPPGQAAQWKRAVLANSPDSWSYQHFLDRVTKILVQAEAWREEGTHVVSGAETSSQHVTDIWTSLLEQGGKQQVEHSTPVFSAEELVFSCRCPMVHPFFHERLRELLAAPQPAPLQDRKVVLYLSRNNDTGGNSGDRRVTNEGAVLAAIRRVLKERDLEERLEVYDGTRFPHLADLTAHLAANVSAVLGPHGGAWYNAMWWAPADTLLIEFLPTERFGTLVWEEGSMLGRHTIVTLWNSSQPGFDMQVDPQLVARGLRDHLGQQRGPGAAAEAAAAGRPSEPRQHYNWDLQELL